MTLIQPFGSALNLNIHCHMLCLDGAYTLANGRPGFRRVPPPTPGEDAALEILQDHSITYRIAMGPHEGRKAFTLQTVPASERPTRPFLATHAGFSLHAGVAVRGGDKKTLERLCRYITRDIRVQLTGINQGHDRYVVLDLGAAVVPIPAAAWLFGGALGALGIVKRRQKSA